MPSVRIAVVGGGLAGLAAADALERRGLQVRVLERAERPGGRAASTEAKSFGYEPGAHVVSDADLRLIGLVERVGLAPACLPLRPIALAQAGRRGARGIDPTRRVGLARSLGVRWRETWRLPRLERLLARFGASLDPEAPERAAAQDDRSVADFARLYFGRSVLARWLAPWLAEHAGADPEQASRVLVLQLLAHRRFPFEGRLRGELALISAALAARVEVATGEEVTAVEPSAGGFAVHHRREGVEATTDAEAVVLALPAPEARRVAAAALTHAELDRLGELRYASALSVAAGLDAPLARHPTRVRVAPELGSPVTSALLEPGVPGARVPEGRGLALLVAARPRPSLLGSADEAVSQRLLAELDRLVPGAARGVSWTRVHRHPYAWPRFDVGHYRALERLRRVEADRRAHGRRLYHAGDHLVAPTLDGAVTSGLRAARALIEDL